MIFKNAMVTRVEGAPAHQAEVGGELFVLQTPNGAALPPWIGLQRYPANVLLLGGTLLKARITSAKDGPENTITGCRIARTSGPETQAVTDTTGLLC
jgi:hypothetical protein